MRKGRLKGFTLTEIIITMLISSILIGIAIKLFILLFTIGNQNSMVESKSDKMIFLNSILSEAVFNAAFINKTTDDLIELKSDKGTTMTIEFKPSILIIRQESRTDSLQIDWNNLQFSLIDSASNLVNKFSLELGSGSTVYPIVFKKEYPKKLLYKIKYGQDENKNL